MEQKEPTEEEIEGLIEEVKEFVDSLSKEMEGKQAGEILPFDIAMITSVCLTKLFLHTPSTVMIKHELSIATLIANSILKHQEKKLKENAALEKLWKED